MAAVDKARSNHVFPIYLDAAKRTQTAAAALKVDTSYYELIPTTGNNGDVSYTLPDGKIPGQLMIIVNRTADSSDAIVTVDTGINDDTDRFHLNDLADSITLMWIGNAWICLSGESIDTVD